MYKHARFFGQGHYGALGSYLARAIRQLEFVEDRTEVDTQGDESRFVNAYKPVAVDNPMFVGTVFEFTQGRVPVGFTQTQRVSEYEVETLAELAEGRQMILNALHFGVLGNHVIVMPSGALGVDALQQHLQWLLVTQAKVLHEETFVRLYDEPASTKWGEFKRIRSVEVASPLDWQGPETEQEPKQQSSLRSIIQRVQRLVREGVGDMTPSQAASLARMRIRLEVAFEGQVGKADTSLLDAYAAMLPDDVKPMTLLQVSGIGTVRAGDLKIRQPVSVRFDDRLFPVLSDVGEKMHDWLLQLLESGQVSGKE